MNATAYGSIDICGGNGDLAIAFTCSGSGCQVMQDQSNLTCTQTSTGALPTWQCNNGFNCSGQSTSFSSLFSINQTSESLVQTNNVKINGAPFIVSQSVTANTTILNGTNNQPLQPRASNASSSHSRRPSTALILFLLFLLLSSAQVQAVTPAPIQFFQTWSQWSDLHGITSSAMAGAYGEAFQKLCEFVQNANFDRLANTFGKEGSEADLFAQCEEKALSSEITAISRAASLATVELEGIAGGLAGGTVEALAATAVEGFLGVEVGIGLAVMIGNIAVCAWLVDKVYSIPGDLFAQQVCSSNSGSATTTSTTASTMSSMTSSMTSTTSTTSITSSISSRPPSPTGPPIPNLSADACVSCMLSGYFIGVVALSTACNVPSPPTGQASDMSVLFCDSSFNGRYSAFCTGLCNNLCATYDINTWVASAGSQYVPDASLVTCSERCPGFKGDGRCAALPLNCPCGFGADSCGCI